jgi:methylaspartate mutase epsilon subunit
MPKKYRLLIGGLGDDAHSVGISLLGLGFKQEGFAVKNLGIRNTIDDFLKIAGDFDLVMLSNNNGHAELYLQDFGRRLSHYRLTRGASQIWYIGGNLSVSGSSEEIKKRFIQMGFTNVFPKPVGLEEILGEVYRDFARFKVHKRDVGSRYDNGWLNGSRCKLDEVADDRWPLARLETERRAVLSEWETGRDVHSSGEGYIKPAAEKDLAWILSKAREKRREPLVQPRTGVANLENQVSILKFLEASGIHIASVQLDAASRSKLYAQAKTGVDWSRQNGGSFLNGFPVPVHGVSGVRRIVDALKLPFQLRAGGPDHRLTYEIALAGGATGVEGGFICYLFPYDKLTRPADSVKNWQYVDRLCAWYFERHHISINREYFGTLTANLIAPALAIAINIVQAILSVKQGVRSISLGYAEQGNRAQDIAAILSLEKLGNRYLAKYGFPDRRVTTVFHQFMAAFPKDEAKAEDLIYNSAVTAALARATKVMTKTPVEAAKIPSAQENAWGIAIAKRGLRAAAHQSCNWPLINFESHLIEREVTEILNVIEELGNGSIARGAIRAFEEGYLDIPFSPNVHNHNEVVTLRDKAGAIRFAEFGKLPFSSAVKDFHRSRIDERKTLERDSKIASLLEKDLTRIWKNDFRAWPLDGHYVC